MALIIARVGMLMRFRRGELYHPMMLKIRSVPAACGMTSCSSKANVARSFPLSPIDSHQAFREKPSLLNIKSKGLDPEWYICIWVARRAH